MVVPDIHGCCKTLQELLKQKVKLQANDQLFLLGDYIGRGPDSRGVIEYILDLQAQGYEVYPLRGNHEQALLDKANKYSASGKRFMSYIAREKIFDLLDEQQRLDKRYWRFFDELSHFYELDKYLLVHAGFNFDQFNPFLDKQAMLWTRHYEPNEKFLRGKQIVQGHMPTSMKKIMRSIKDKAPRLILDNGCVFLSKLNNREQGKLGHLLCMDLDTQKVFIQRNIDKLVQND
ncbi:hypothetical protein BKI52_06890 [marine bacterium AO1-C]|nr:hypothetical protein BKI52_06890 [marine bacterium AO1-C]